jgi:hypothetical protein
VKWKWPQHQRAHHAENSRTGADSQTDDQHGKTEEAGLTPNSPKRVADVSSKTVDTEWVRHSSVQCFCVVSRPDRIEHACGCAAEAQ